MCKETIICFFAHFKFCSSDVFYASSETDSLALFFARRALSTLRPLAVVMRKRKPCLFFLFLFEG